MKLLMVLAGCCPLDAPIKFRNGRPAPVPAAGGRARAPISPSLPFTKPFTALHGKAPSVPTSQMRRLSSHRESAGRLGPEAPAPGQASTLLSAGQPAQEPPRGNSRSQQILFFTQLLRRNIFPNPEEQPPKNSTSTEFQQREGARPLASYSNVWFNARAQKVLCF